jgi:hypothetical protein
MTDALKPPIEPSEAQLYHNALSAISAIRDSIVGMQSINWSLHVYPLVAALDAAGFEGNGYEVSRAKAAEELQGLRDSVSAKYSQRIAELEADSKRLRHLISRMEIPGAMHQFLSLNNWQPDTFKEGFIAAIDRSIKESER